MDRVLIGLSLRQIRWKTSACKGDKYVEIVFFPPQILGFLLMFFFFFGFSDMSGCTQTVLRGHQLKIMELIL